MLSLLAAAMLSQPNILLVLLDDIGNDKIGCYQEGPPSEQPPTPNIDALAASGLRFTNFYSHPTCTPTRGSVLTGLEPYSHGLGHALGSGQIHPHLPFELTTLPEALTACGYHSGMVGKWHLGRVQETGPFLDPLLHGWELFSGVVASAADYRAYDKWIASEAVTFSLSGTTYLTTAQVDDALTMIGALPEPWFITVSFSAAHLPFHHPPGFEALETNMEKYGAAVEFLDTELGRLLAEPAVASALKVVAGDNGTVSSVSSTPGKAKATLWEGGVNVPLIAAGPGIRAGVSDVLVQCSDLFATVLEMAGSTDPVPATSVSFQPALASALWTGRDHVFSQKFQLATGPQRRQMARGERYKLIRHADLGAGVQEWFVDLESSPPGEDTILSASPPAGLSPAEVNEYQGLASYLDGKPLE